MQKYCMLYFTAAGSWFGYTAKYYCNSSVQVARRTAKSVDDAVGFLSSLLELCETTVVQVCVWGVVQCEGIVYHQPAFGNRLHYCLSYKSESIICGLLLSDIGIFYKYRLNSD